MAGEVYRLLCGGSDDRGGYFSSGGHDDFWYGHVFRLRIMCRFYMITFIMRSIWVSDR